MFVEQTVNENERSQHEQFLRLAIKVRKSSVCERANSMKINRSS